MPGVLDARNRDSAIQALAAGPLDVLVIGGGITGAGAALDAASRGLRVGLVEARDLASGTSTRSSKLIHGGLRYLEQGDFKLVREALRERDLLVCRLAPHLVRPVPFLYPLYKKVVERPYVGAGLVLYDAMEGVKRPVPHHRHLTTKGATRKAPALRPDRLAGAMTYYDAQVDDARYTLTVARTAARHGAHVVTRARAVSLLRDGNRVTGRGVRDEQTGRSSTCSRPGDGVRRGVVGPGPRGERVGVPGADVQGRAPDPAAGGDRRRDRDDPADEQAACCSLSRGTTAGSSGPPTPTGPATGPSPPPRSRRDYILARRQPRAGQAADQVGCARGLRGAAAAGADPCRLRGVAAEPTTSCPASTWSIRRCRAWCRSPEESSPPIGSWRGT